MTPHVLPKFVSTREAAEALGSSRGRVALLIREGKIKAARIGPKGRWRIPVAELERLAAGERGAP